MNIYLVNPEYTRFYVYSGLLLKVYIEVTCTCIVVWRGSNFVCLAYLTGQQ